MHQGQVANRRIGPTTAVEQVPTVPLYVVRRAGFDATAVCRELADPSWLGLETDTPHGSAPVRARLFPVLAGRLIVQVAKRRIGANRRRGCTLAPSSPSDASDMHHSGR